MTTPGPLEPVKVQCPHCQGWFTTDEAPDHVPSCPRRPRDPLKPR